MNETQSRTQLNSSFNDNEQLTLALHETCDVKQRAGPLTSKSFSNGSGNM